MMLVRKSVVLLWVGRLPVMPNFSGPPLVPIAYFVYLFAHTISCGWSHAWVLHGPEGSAVVSLKTISCACGRSKRGSGPTYLVLLILTNMYSCSDIIGLIFGLL